VAEWLNAPDCKSGRLTPYEGSNPSPSNIVERANCFARERIRKPERCAKRREAGSIGASESELTSDRILPRPIFYKTLFCKKFLTTYSLLLLFKSYFSVRMGDTDCSTGNGCSAVLRYVVMVITSMIKLITNKINAQGFHFGNSSDMVHAIN
jgi:hypothetical protein